MIAVVCDTPYQLMSAVLVADRVAKNDPIVFFINTYLYFKEQKFNYSDNHSGIHKILYYGRKHMGAGKLLAGLINPQSMLRHIEGYDPSMDFSAIISSRTTYMATYLYNEYVKRHPNIPVYLVEEGIGEYTSNMVHTRFTKACAMLRRKTHMDHVTRAFLSAPSLYPYKPAFPVEKVPRLTDNSREIIETMFNLDALREGGNLLDRYHCIFLSEPNSCEMTNKDDALAYDKLEDEITDLVAQTAGLSDTIIKVHPIDPFYKKDNIETFYTQLPMESLILTMDCGNKYFVSSMSTAMLTPKLLFNEEPYLIFTYKLLDDHLKKFLCDDALRNRYYQFIEGVIGLYSDKTRCAVPDDMEELRVVVSKFRSEVSSLPG